MNNVYVFNPLFNKILESEVDSTAMKNKLNIEAVHKKALTNNKIRNKLVKSKNEALKKLMTTNNEIPGSWQRRPDYHKYIHKVFEDRNLEEYMRKSYPTEQICTLNMNVKNKEYKQKNNESIKSVEKNLVFKIKDKGSNKTTFNLEEATFLKMIKIKEADEFYSKNKELFVDTPATKDNTEYLRYTNMMNTLDFLSTESNFEDKDKDGSEFLQREKARLNKKKRRDGDIDTALQLISLGKQTKKDLIENKDSNSKNFNNLFGMPVSPFKSPKNNLRRSTIRKGSIIRSPLQKSKRNSLILSSKENTSRHSSNKVLIGINSKDGLEINSKQFKFQISNKDENFIKSSSYINIITEEVKEKSIFTQSSIKEDTQGNLLDSPGKSILILKQMDEKSRARNSLIIKNSDFKVNLIRETEENTGSNSFINNNEKQRIREESTIFVKNQRERKFDKMYNNKKQISTEFKLKPLSDKNPIYYGQENMVKASTFNKVLKFDKLPKIENNKVKNLIYDLKEYTSFGPYLSSCQTCNLKNINFYNSCDSNHALSILKSIKSNTIDRKDLFGDI